MRFDGVSISGQGPNVVFLHSSLSSRKQWQSLTKQLSEHFTCINIDLLGYGDAPQVVDPDDYSFDSELSRIIEIVDSHSADKKFHLVGHSCGGAIALKCAVQQSDRLLSLALYEPVAFHLCDAQDEHMRQAKIFEDNIPTLPNKQMAQTFLDYWNFPGFFAALPSAVQQMMVSAVDKVKLDFKGIFAEQYSYDDLVSIQVPCTIVVGQQTTELSHHLSQHIATSITTACLVSVDAGHMGPVTHPHLVEPLILDFLHSQLAINSRG